MAWWPFTLSSACASLCDNFKNKAHYLFMFRQLRSHALQTRYKLNTLHCPPVAVSGAAACSRQGDALLWAPRVGEDASSFSTSWLRKFFPERVVSRFGLRYATVDMLLIPVLPAQLLPARAALL